uniref:TPR repeat protein n=1 Tax=uncultured marine bacterium 583 TaxID=257403 RepID=Q6SES8_9BACT|nr:TPR repeat protein [uncultured marine bacterium 583]
MTIKPQRLPQAQINSVIALYSNGQIHEALDAVEALIKDDPHEPLLFNISGACYVGLGQLDESVTRYERAIAIKPDYVEAHNNLGNVLKELGQRDTAVKSFEQALAIKPDYAEAHNNLGVTLQELGQLDAAVKCYEQALAIKPDYAEAHNNLGVTLQDLGQVDRSIKSLNKALAIKPDYAQARNNLGVSFQERGQIDGAVKQYEQAVAIKPDYASAHHNLSVLKKYTASDPQITQMQSLLSTSNLSQSDRIHLCFALARVYENLGKQDEFFEFLHEGNRLRKQELNYSLDSSQNLFYIVKKIFNTPPSLSYEPSTIRPIFIVGMLRSGTTLVEQIIASHHAVYGAGELTTLATLIEPIAKDYLAKDKNNLPEKAFLSIRQQYLDSLSGFNVPENVITDKMPLNFQYIGFILSAFPEAKIVHLQRDARATCWSIYKHYFSSAGNGWAYNLEDLAGFYGLYTDLMDFWHQSFPDKIYDLCYEDLTTNQEEETRKLLEYCELDWDENCLNFHTSKRAVRTASALQVRQKMYQGSSEAWKKYEANLEPLIKALDSNSLNQLVEKGLKDPQNVKVNKKNQLGPSQEQINSVIGLYSNGQIQEALDTVETLIKDYPNEPLFYNISGACYAGLGQLDTAIKRYEKALVIKPDYAEVHNNLGIALKDLGQRDTAVKSFEQALAIKPDYAEAHNNLGVTLQELGQHDTAVKSYEQAIAIKPDYAEAHNNLGNALRELDQLDAALKSYEQAIVINPEYAVAHYNLGIVLKELGQRDTAVKSFEKALAIKPDYVKVHHSLSTMKRYKINDPQITQMQSLLSTSNLSQSDRINLCFALTKVYENLGKQDEFFKFLHEGNRLRKQELNYSLDKDEDMHSIFKKMFISPPSLSYEPSTIRPIFIVGMPRSGTTLVEQIIASHHAVYGAGELTTLATLIEPIAKDYLAKDKNNLPEKAFLSIRQQYLDSLSGFNVPENVITDKLPLNFQYIGFILSAFPEAKIVHLQRDARATCWSNYQTYFLSKENGYSYNLEDLAGFYGLYTDLMDFWHQSFPDKIYDLCYEDLTTNQEEETRKLLEYCELDWDENCLNFHTSKRAVRTASALQVRQKMYQGSSEAWKKYEAHLEPLIKALSSY